MSTKEEEIKPKKLKFEATLHMNLDEVRAPRSYIDYQTRDPKTKKLGLKRMEEMSYDFTYDSMAPEIFPSIEVTLTTENEELMEEFLKRRYNLTGYRWKVTLEEEPFSYEIKDNNKEVFDEQTKKLNRLTTS